MLHALLSIDTGLSRVDPSTFSEQTRMEIFIDRLDDESKKHFLESDGGFLEVQKWTGIMPDDKGKVISIDWRKCRFSGTLSLDMLPDTLKSIKILGSRSGLSTHALYGTIDTAALPCGLERCVLENLKFSGSLQLPALPMGLTHFSVQDNMLGGEIVFIEIPQCLEILDLSGNTFMGTVQTAALPRTLQKFCISNNKMEGTLDMTKLPPGLVMFSVTKNNFHGTLDLSQLPASLRDCYMAGNPFHGEISLRNLPQKMSSLILEQGRFEGVDMATNPRCVIFKPGWLYSREY